MQKEYTDLPLKLSTTIENIDTKVSISYNKETIFKFYEYSKNISTLENYQNGVIKAIIYFFEKDYNHNEKILFIFRNFFRNL